MSTTLELVLAVAGLTWLSLWLSVRAAPYTAVDHLPVRQRRRVKWWLANASRVQVGCLVVIAVTMAVQLGRVSGLA